MARHIQPLALALLAAAGVVSLAAPGAHAQTPGEVVIDVDRPVLEPGESTTVRLLAGFGASEYGMAGVMTGLLADAGGVDIAAAWSDAALVAPMDGPGTSAGLPEGGGFAGIIAGKLNFPPTGGMPDPNPITFWEATFTAPTDAGRFNVGLSTLTTRFDVYPTREATLGESRLDGLTEGQGRIVVVPAPAGGLVLGLGLASMRRRR